MNSETESVKLPVMEHDSDEENERSIFRHIHQEPETDLASSTINAPQDHFMGVYIIFIFLGMGILFPWNTFLTSSDYFIKLYPKFPYDFFVSLAYNYPSLVMLLLSVKWGHKLSFSSRILFSFAIDLVVLVSIPIISKYFPTNVALSLTFVGVFLTGVATAILFGAVMGMAALFPPTYTGAVMAGNGWAGIVPAILRIITKASLPNSKEGLQESATAFFTITGFVILACIVAQLILPTLPFTKFMLHNLHRKHKSHIQDEEQSLLPQKENQQESASIIGVFKHIWQSAFLVFFVFFVTLSLFPGMTGLIKSHGEGLSDPWFQLILVTLFMVGDLCGRSLPRWLILFNRHTLWYPVLARAIFFPLFVMCLKIDAFKQNYVAFILMLAFAFSNGYCGTLAMMYGPSSPGLCDHEREMAGTQMSFFLNLGIFTAIHFAFLVLYLTTGSIGIHL